MRRTPEQWEATTTRWSKPEGVNEEERCDNAERMIREAIRQSPALAHLNIEVFAQGSFRNRTNVARESDVDVCVVCHNNVFFDFELTPNLGMEQYGFSPSTYTYYDFKADVGRALAAKFRTGVSRGDKAFNLTANTYRVEADVLPTFESRAFFSRPDGSTYHLEGVGFETDGGRRVYNWPKQHIVNGIQKNEATGRRFKPVARALKALRYEMDDMGILAAKYVPSFLIESLAYETPNEFFGHDTLLGDLRSVIAFTFDRTTDASRSSDWTEPNGIKYLFHGSQPWTREQANNFLGAAWAYLHA